jgi:hypothetical protein
MLGREEIRAPAARLGAGDGVSVTLVLTVKVDAAVEGGLSVARRSSGGRTEQADRETLASAS